jgi:hypothetical protein
MAATTIFPPLELDDWEPTRDALWGYARCLGSIRRALVDPARHWSHVSLTVGTRGPTTGPLKTAGDRFELRLDIRNAQVVLDSESGRAWAGHLPGTPFEEILDRVQGWISRTGGESPLDVDRPESEAGTGYDQAAAERYWSALSRIEAVFAAFAGGLRGETHGPQLWPHHFDLAVLWLSGRQVPGEDPEDEEAADESMNFGFSTGDEGIPNPYFYVTAYPQPESFETTQLPPGAKWHTQGWSGARLDYAELISTEDPGARLLTFLTHVQRAGAESMAAHASDV